MTGTRIGNWMLGAEMGRGPLGTVFQARAIDGSAMAALKLLTPDAIRDPANLGKFSGELLALRRLAHPNIATFLEAGVHAGQAYYVREWVDGVDLATLIHNGHSPESWRELAIPLTVQLAWALNHGHRRSLLHRRLTPSNVIVSSTGHVKVTDFGIAKVVPVAPLSLSPEPWGSLAFLAPEQFTGKPYTRKSDLYSLGAVVYAAVTGRPPFSAATAAEYLHKHCYLLPDRPVNFVPKLPAEFDDLICSLLSKDPSRRPTAAPAVIEEMDRVRGKLERKGERVPWPQDPGDTSLHAPLSETTIAEVKGEETRVVRQRPLLSQKWVVLPLFLAVVAVIAFALLRPGPTANEYYENAQKLLATGKPEDAEKAWDDYLEPLQRKYPGQFTDEIATLRDRRIVGRDLTKALDQGAKARFGSEAERLYQRGVAVARLGEFAEAKQLWEKVLTLVEPGDRWFHLSKHALDELAKKVKE